MPYVLREVEVIGIDTLNDVRRGDFVGVYDTKDEAVDELDRLVDELEEDLKSEGFVILDRDEFGVYYCTQEEYDEMEKEGVTEGYDYIGYDVYEVSEEDAENIKKQLL
ncbi:MAG: hypothetical protein ACPL3B_04955 [Fervidobacterium sp.]